MSAKRFLVRSLIPLVAVLIISSCSIETSIPPKTPVPAQLLQPNVDVIITPHDVISKDLGDIVKEYSEGTRFLIKAGTYRMQSIVPKKGMVFYGDVDTAGKRYTILNGSRLLANFQQADGLYFVTGQQQEGETQGEMDAGWEGSVHSEDLFFDDVALQQVLSKSEVESGKWYFDYANDTIWFADNPAGHKVETSVTPYAFFEYNSGGMGTQVAIKGFIVEKYANRAQAGAIGGIWGNDQWHVEYNETRLNHGAGILVGSKSRVLHNYSHHNGQIGLGVRGDGSMFQGNEVSYNNTMHFKKGWGAGGAKFAALNGLVFKDNYVHHNNGRGLWIDIGSHNVLIDNNLITYNYNEGIFYEVSDTGTITNNRLAHNGQDSSWQFGGGITLSSSSDIDVGNNSVVVNQNYGNGITVLWTDRHLSYAESGHTPPLRVENIHVHNNDVTYLGVLNIQNDKTPASGATAGGSGVDEWSENGVINGVEPLDAYVVNSNVSIIEPRLNNRYTDNTYHVSDLLRKWFVWGGAVSRISWDEFRSAGNDLDGTIDTNVVDKSTTWSWLSSTDITSLTAEVVY